MPRSKITLPRAPTSPTSPVICSVQSSALSRTRCPRSCWRASGTKATRCSPTSPTGISCSATARARSPRRVPRARSVLRSSLRRAMPAERLRLPVAVRAAWPRPRRARTSPEDYSPAFDGPDARMHPARSFAGGLHCVMHVLRSWRSLWTSGGPHWCLWFGFWPPYRVDRPCSLMFSQVEKLAFCRLLCRCLQNRTVNEWLRTLWRCCTP